VVYIKRQLWVKLGYWLLGIPASAVLALGASFGVVLIKDIPDFEGASGYAVAYMMPFWFFAFLMLLVLSYRPVTRDKRRFFAAMVAFGVILFAVPALLDSVHN